MNQRIVFYQNEKLVFLKQLLDNIEFASEEGILNVIKLFRSEFPEVRKGTSYALGAFDTLLRLTDLGPELFTNKVINQLRLLTNDNDMEVRAIASKALSKLI